ncbi:beta-1,4-glucuronyltransferase 1-like isoform X2 [Oratosquilla oratoria]|uniref:beta-1,4-glucuronyltransferase 1-like isoform X2 n=1 Tax=Oratosquilla oratoria TaxID=337810 RepID=UPI003F76C978
MLHSWTRWRRSLHAVMACRRVLAVHVTVVMLNALLGIVVNLYVFNTRFVVVRRAAPTLPPPNGSNVVNTNATNQVDFLSPVHASEGLRDNTGNFSSHTFVARASMWTNPDVRVSLATQASADRLFWVARQIETWDGPVSVAVFVPGKNYAVAVRMIKYLRRCFHGVRERVAFHMTYPRAQPPVDVAWDDLNLEDLDCDDPIGVNAMLKDLQGGHRQDEGQMYPQNLLRNMARRTCPTPFTLTIDVDMLPAPDMAHRLDTFLATRAVQVCHRCTYVIPVYEIHDTVTEMPGTKDDLLRMRARDLAQPFHIQVYALNQGNSNLQRWEEDEDPRNSTNYRIAYRVSTYEEYWEPILVVPTAAPLYDERFIGYGFTRSSHIYMLHKYAYRFLVLDKAFLSHEGFQTSVHYPKYRRKEIESNKLRYAAFKRELHARLNLPAPSSSQSQGGRQSRKDAP